MSSSKIPSKLTRSNDKSKRKRPRETTDIATTQTTDVKKHKRLRSDKDTPTIDHLPRARDKTSKEERKKLVSTASSTRQEEDPKERTAKETVPPASVPNNDQGMGEVTTMHLDAKPLDILEENEMAPDVSAMPRRDREEEEEIQLQGFTSESDSSDEDVAVADQPALDISKLPKFPKDDISIQRKLDKAKKNPTEDRGVIYLGRIPHGFYEDQMRTYFSQFGDVSRLRLSRNKKTGHSKHYAFIEFSSSAVAEIVSDTMDNYLLLGHILKCKVIPKEKIHPELWVGANKKWRMVPRDRVARVRQNKRRTEEEQQRAESRLLARQEEKKSKILELGIDYDFEAMGYKKSLRDSPGIVPGTRQSKAL